MVNKVNLFTHRLYENGNDRCSLQCMFHMDVYLSTGLETVGFLLISMNRFAL